MVFTVADLQDSPQSCCSSPLLLGMATQQCQDDLEVERKRREFDLHSYILDCIYSSTIKNSRTSQLTFGKAYKRLLFAYGFEKPVGEEARFDESVVSNLKM